MVSEQRVSDRPERLRCGWAVLRLTFHALVSDIAGSCTPTSTVTRDQSEFYLELRNQVCNGPAPCNFGSRIADPGSMAYASGTSHYSINPYFRVAQIGLCAVAAGQAVLHWEFSPPAPADRDSRITDQFGMISNRKLFTDYVVNVTAITSTPTPTITPGGPTLTPTRTRTPTITPTPACGLAWRMVDSPEAGPGENRLNGVAALAPDDVWAVGYHYPSNPPLTLIEHWDGTQWSIVPSPNPGITGARLNGVAAVSPNDVWAVGSAGDYTLAARYNDPCLTPTGTATNTPTYTPTSTSTPSRTPTSQPGANCLYTIAQFQPCFQAGGCVDYSIPLRNLDDSGVVVSGTVQLKSRDEVVGQAAIPPTYLGPGATVYVEGTICPSPAGRGPYKVVAEVQDTVRACNPRHRQQPVVGSCTQPIR